MKSFRRTRPLRSKIQTVLITYYLTPILLILLASGTLFYFSARRSLDEEMGKRLTSVAWTAASQIRAFSVAALALHDPKSDTYQSLHERFETIRKNNQLARMYLFDPADVSLLDTDKTFDPGTVYDRNRLHRFELAQVMRGNAVPSVLFQSSDGEYFKSAFAPVLDEGHVVAIVGVDGNARFFRNLHLLGRRLAYFAIACITIIVLVSILISRKIVVPTQLLMHAARRIGEGHLEEPIHVTAQNEIGFLARVMEEMRKNIISRDREVQTMLQGIAHEVRNPLGGIELFAGMLNEEVPDGSGRDAVVRIQNEVRVLKNLVEEFLDFARKQTLQISTVKLHPFLEELKLPFQREMEKRSIDFSTKADGVAEADIDPDQMRRAFLNLIRNAVQAMPQGGKIEVAARAQNGQVEVAVTDTGVGIAERDLEKIFDPFFTTKEGGTGLGLAFVKKIVLAHGGEVEVKSASGTGTTFTVLLPR